MTQHKRNNPAMALTTISPKNQRQHPRLLRALLLASLLSEALWVHTVSAQVVTTPAKPDAATKPESKAEKKLDGKSDNKPATKTETKPENKPDAKPDVKAEVKPDTTPEVDASTVTVTAERPSNRIDRQVYDVKSDVNSSNGTAADALNNIPSVNVDPDGTVSLRGSTKVQILIDGKPSAMLQGDNRGATLLAMPSHDIESVEVINNPGAQFGNEAGGGPILNLVMRRTRQPGGFGVINANGGSAGRYNSAFSGSYHEGAFGIQGGVNVRHDGRNSVGDVSRDRLDTLTHDSQTSTAKGLNNSSCLNATLSYNLGAKDTLAASFAYSIRNNDQQSENHYQTYDQANTLLSDYVRTGLRKGDSSNYSWGGRYDHKGDLNGETLKLDLRVSSSENASQNNYANVYAVAPGFLSDKYSLQDNKTSVKLVDFTGDYERPHHDGLIKLGYKIADNKSDFDTGYFDINPVNSVPVINKDRSNRYSLDEGNLALYGSYQLRLDENWGVLAGLRTEYTHIDIQQQSANVEATNHYISYIPSFFASYKASEDTTLRFSYAHRIRRASASELNPFKVYRDDLNESSGNPKLKPTQTDSFELAYETRVAKLDMNIRGYYRKESDAIVYHRYFLSDGILLTTPENGGGSHTSGLEFTLSGKVTPKFSINTSGNLLFGEQTYVNTAGQEVRRPANSLSVRGRFNYQLTDDDHLQLSINTQGRTVSGEGYRQPNSTANFSYRHNISKSLNLVMNVTDIFNSNKTETQVDTDILRERSIRRYDGRLIYIGFSYRFGGANTGSGNSRPARG
ncbi:TonB-dependent receptor domain-containing protein [Undibacterium sp. Di27W]|uniref:TonB-dependent receptor domain-containing protein n=1 Tax=Undibacterium sp. Di27W TaxID=3413036 RepID=UPI003BF0E911